jgi:formylglycine-generating enzyme
VDWRRLGLGGWLFVAVACSRPKPTGHQAPSASARPSASAAHYEILYLPDGSDRVPSPAPPTAAPALPPKHGGTCPKDMVDVRGEFCVDRYEAVLVDQSQGRRLSPYYAPSREGTRNAFELWEKKRLDSETALGRTMPLIPPPDWQLAANFEPRAVSLGGEIPNGYVSGVLAAVACKNAHKRLCTAEEWLTACRGEKARKFPYGDEYVQGRCNVFREAHPAAELHGNASIGHTDPRLNSVEAGGKPLLKRTGKTPDCRSEWGSDSVFDMVGNLDEWVDDPGGLFLGGFYARSTKAGCEARVSAHPPAYFDYSLGVRCCLTPGT